MADLTIVFLGDIVGAPGRRVVMQQLPRLRAEHEPDLVIANAENARNGSGFNGDLYERLRETGIEAFTLGDHCYRDARVLALLEKPGAMVARPANLSARAVGRRVTTVPPAGRRTRNVSVMTLLGRVYFPLPADDPFAAADELLTAIPEQHPIVIVEAHMEATSEKSALAQYLDGRVTAVIGSHTHVPTADARLLPGGTAFITDVGMCGPYESVIGRTTAQVLRFMTTGMHTTLEVGEGGEMLCAVKLVVDESTGRARSIERLQYRADRSAPPFV